MSEVAARQIEREATIARNLATVRQRIADATARSGRSSDDVRLVAATKYVGLPEIEALLAAGCRDFGESRPQDLWRKAAGPSNLPRPLGEGRGEAALPIAWHLIGHLQRNKVRRTVPL